MQIDVRVRRPLRIDERKRAERCHVVRIQNQRAVQRAVRIATHVTRQARFPGSESQVRELLDRSERLDVRIKRDSLTVELRADIDPAIQITFDKGAVEGEVRVLKGAVGERSARNRAVER